MLHHSRRFSGAGVVRVPTKSAAPPASAWAQQKWRLSRRQVTP